MASVYKKTRGGFEIRYRDADGKERSLYPGQQITNKRDAEGLGTKIDHLVSRKILSSEPDPAVLKELAKLPEKLYSKLAKHGLVAPRAAAVESEPDPIPTLRQWCDQYIAKHSGRPSTIEQLEITARALCYRMGDHVLITKITAGDAEDWRKWLESEGNERKDYSCGLALNTVRRRIGRAKQFFNSAVKHKLIESNPFADEISATSGNAERLFFVPAEWIEKIIRQTDCEDWRIMLALARYGGLRSHETRIQRWEDIDIPNRTMIIRSHKTPPVRRVPIFPELMPHLMRAREMAGEGADLIVTRYTHDANIGTTLSKMITKAGYVPWARLMQNLRATRETELTSTFPIKDVTSWIGNSPTVAGKHYLMPTSDAFKRATMESAKVPEMSPETPHHQAGQDVTPKPADAPDIEKTYGELLESLSVHLSSCPTRT